MHVTGTYDVQHVCMYVLHKIERNNISGDALSCEQELIYYRDRLDVPCRYVIGMYQCKLRILLWRSQIKCQKTCRVFRSKRRRGVCEFSATSRRHDQNAACFVDNCNRWKNRFFFFLKSEKSETHNTTITIIAIPVCVYRGSRTRAHTVHYIRLV